MRSAQILRVFGLLELALGAVLAGGAFFIHANFQGPVLELVKAGADNVTRLAGSVSQTAEALEQQQAALRSATDTLKAVRAVAKEIHAMSEEQAKAIPTYAAALRDVAVTAKAVGGGLDRTGQQLDISIPTGVVLQGATPKLVMGRPMSALAAQTREQAATLMRVSDALSALAGTIGTRGIALSSGLAETAKQTMLLSDQLANSATKVGDVDLPRTIRDMRDVSVSMRGIGSQSVRAVEAVELILVTVLGTAALTLGFLGALCIWLGREPIRPADGRQVPVG